MCCRMCGCVCVSVCVCVCVWERERERERGKQRKEKKKQKMLNRERERESERERVSDCSSERAMRTDREIGDLSIFFVSTHIRIHTHTHTHRMISVYSVSLFHFFCVFFPHISRLWLSPMLLTNLLPYEIFASSSLHEGIISSWI